MLSSHSPSTDFYTPGFMTKMLHIFIFFPKRATYPVHLIFIHLSTSIKHVEISHALFAGNSNPAGNSLSVVDCQFCEKYFLKLPICIIPSYYLF
jgi:hypothetical protein